jgi:hypothetical protein
MAHGADGSLKGSAVNARVKKGPYPFFAGTFSPERRSPFRVASFRKRGYDPFP